MYMNKPSDNKEANFARISDSIYVTYRYHAVLRVRQAIKTKGGANNDAKGSLREVNPYYMMVTR